MPTLPLPAEIPPGLALLRPPIFPPLPGLPVPIPPPGLALPPGRVGRAMVPPLPGLPVEIPPGPPGFRGGLRLPVILPRPGRALGRPFPATAFAMKPLLYWYSIGILILELSFRRMCPLRSWLGPMLILSSQTFGSARPAPCLMGTLSMFTTPSRGRQQCSTLASDGSSANDRD